MVVAPEDFQPAFKAIAFALGRSPGEYVRLAQQLHPSLLLLQGPHYWEALFRMAALNRLARLSAPERPGQVIGFERGQLHMQWPDATVTCHYPDELCPAL